MLMAEKGYENETFPAFIARLRSTAVKARKDNKEWFHQFWKKLTQQIRNSSYQVKGLWNENFEKIVTSITLIDQDRRRNYELNPIRQRTVPTSAARNVSTTAQAAVRKPLRITSGTATTPSLPWKPTPAIRSESSRPPPILPHHNPEHKDVTCFHCH